MLDFHAPGALEAGDGQGRMETHRWAWGASLGWGDGDWEAVQREMDPPSVGSQEGGADRDVVRSNLVLTSPYLSFPLCGKEKKDP